MDFDVHRNGDSGSPRVAGSTSASSASTKPGSVSVSGLRPPPERRTRPTDDASPAPPNSRTALDTVGSDTPAARATALIPPRPRLRASAPITTRR